ncbi:MAG: hypothetical protein WA876_09730, partial [Candidatus Acidiferrales bacterium]
ISYFTTAVIALAVAVGATRGAPPAAKKVSLSIAGLSIASGERVVGFEFHIRSGRITQVRDAPIGWNISVDNDPSWNTRVNGSAIVAAAALDASFFRNFLVVAKKESLGNSFEIHGDIVVTRDFVKERRIPVTMRELTLTPVSR